MTPHPHRQSRSHAYSLVELTIATSILAAGVAAAASLTMTSTRIEDMNHRKARVVALTEAAARLWQLGLTPTEAATILPGDPALNTINFDGGTTAPNNQGTAVDPATDLGTFEEVTIEASVLMRESSTSTSGDAVTHPLQTIRVIR